VADAPSILSDNVLERYEAVEAAPCSRGGTHSWYNLDDDPDCSFETVCDKCWRPFDDIEAEMVASAKARGV
jgi:hypothetical protein